MTHVNECSTSYGATSLVLYSDLNDLQNAHYTDTKTVNLPGTNIIYLYKNIQAIAHMYVYHYLRTLIASSTGEIKNFPHSLRILAVEPVTSILLFDAMISFSFLQVSSASPQTRYLEMSP